MSDIITGLAARYTFDGHGLDVTGNGRHLTLTGTMPYLTGKIGRGCTPNGVNYWRYANPTWMNGLTAWSIGCWVLGSAYNINECAWSIGTATNAGSVICYPFDTANGNGCKMFANNVLTGLDLNNSRPALSSWQHLLVVCENAASAKLYVNGVLEATDVTNSHALNASLTTLSIGNYHNAAQNYAGSIDDFRMYTRALDPSDAMDLFLYSESSGPQRLGMGLRLGL